MNAETKSRTLDCFRAANCKAASCAVCGTNRLCMLYAFFSAYTENRRTGREAAAEAPEDRGFRAADAGEEQAKGKGEEQ